ncbi:MAG: RidA family protein [Hydrogenophaga sp.]|uniref:RidA family protein n=1 Tax=Hydrogenophaga sp. TaxID=1904254 RepID=UPI003D9BD158
MDAPQRVTCPEVPDRPGASWTNAWRLGHEVVMSGMTGHPTTQQAAAQGQPLGAYEQTLVVLRKLEALVRAAGGHKHNIVKTVVYVTDIADKDAVGRARHDFFEGTYPSSTLVAVSALVFPELTVEIDAWARLDVDLRAAASLQSEA